MKKIFVTIISLFLCLGFVNAKEPELLWEKTWGDDATNEIYYATDSYNGTNHYAVGFQTKNSLHYKKNSRNIDESSLSVFKKESNDKARKGTIVKYDSNGNVLWERVNNNVYVFLKVKETSDSGALAFGLSLNENNQTSGDAMPFSLILVKYDPNGDVLWEKIIPLDNYKLSEISLFVNSIDFVKNDNIILTFGNLIIKLDKNSNILWTKEISESDNSDAEVYVYDNYGDSDYNIISVGNGSETSTDNDGNTSSKYYKKIIKFDENGNILYSKKIDIDNSSNHKSSLMSVAENKNKEYVIVSYNYDFTVNDEGNKEITKKYLSFEIYDKNGNYKSKKDLILTDEDDMIGILKLHVDKNDNYLVNFYTSNLYTFIKKYDRDLNLMWSKEPDEYSVFMGFNIDKYNNYIIVGGLHTIFGSSLKEPLFEGIDNLINIDQAYIVKYSAEYTIIKEVEGKGEVNVNLDNARAGDEITIDAKAVDGYRIDKIIVTDKDGNIIKVSGNKFVMPNSDVTVKVIFTNSPLVNPKTGMISITFAVVAISVFAFFQYKYFKTKEINL